MGGTNQFRLDLLFKKQRGICHWCNMRMLPHLKSDPDNPLNCTVDHLRPKDGTRREYVGAHRLYNATRHHEPEPPPRTFEIIRRKLLNLEPPKKKKFYQGPKTHHATTPLAQVFEGINFPPIHAHD